MVRRLAGRLAASVVLVAVTLSALPDSASGRPIVAVAVARSPTLSGRDSVVPFGTAARVATARLTGLNAPLVSVAPTPDGRGYWLVAADGGVFACGDAGFFGSAGGARLPAPIVDMAATGDGRGYWLVSAEGRITAFGDARLFGSTDGIRLDEPIVGMSAAPDGRGYWLVAADGGVFAFGRARFFGSAGGIRPGEPIVGMSATPDGRGYWLVAADGGVFAFGDARDFGSAGAIRLNEPIVGMSATPNGRGYWLVAADGGVFAYGDAKFFGSGGNRSLGAPVVGIAAAPGGRGYWLATGEAPEIASAIGTYVSARFDNVTAAVYDIATDRTYIFRAGAVEHTASTLKVDILATLLAETQASGPLTRAEQALAVPMIEDSLDSAADELWVRLGSAAVGAFERAAGMTSTVPATDGIWGTTTTTALDRLEMLRTVVFPNRLLDKASRAYILDLMEHVTPSQAWGATGGVPSGVTVALKNGFAPIVGWQINTTGWVDGDGRDYLIAVLTDGNASEAYGIQTVNAVSAIVWNKL